jgi:hypothetical protein
MPLTLSRSPCIQSLFFDGAHHVPPLQFLEIPGLRSFETCLHEKASMRVVTLRVGVEMLKAFDKRSSSGTDEGDYSSSTPHAPHSIKVTLHTVTLFRWCSPRRRRPIARVESEGRVGARAGVANRRSGRVRVSIDPSLYQGHLAYSHSFSMVLTTCPLYSFSKFPNSTSG